MDRLKGMRVLLALALLIGALVPRAADSARVEWKNVNLGTITHGTASAETATFNSIDGSVVYFAYVASADTLNLSYQVSYDGTNWFQWNGIAAANVMTGSGTVADKHDVFLMDEIGFTAAEAASNPVSVPNFRVIVTADPTAGAASNGDGDNATKVVISLGVVR